MRNFAGRMMFLLGIAILTLGLLGCPDGDSGTDPDSGDGGSSGSGSSGDGKLLSLIIHTPTKTDYLWGEPFDSTGMILEIEYSDHTRKVIADYTETAGAFTVEKNKLTGKGGDYTIEIQGFTNTDGFDNYGNNISLTVNVMDAEKTNRVWNQFNVNIAELKGLAVTTTSAFAENQHYYLGQKLFSGTTQPELEKLGIKVLGKYAGIVTDQPLPESIKLSLRSGVNGSEYADVGGVQSLEVVAEEVDGLLASLAQSIIVHIDPTDTVVYAGGESWVGPTFMEMAKVNPAKIQVSPAAADPISGIGAGAFNSEKLLALGKDSEETHTINIESFNIGRYEVTYELWYAVYKWAITKKEPYHFSDWDYSANVNQGLGLLTGTGIAGTPPPRTKGATSRYMPVHGIDWIDAVVWCNAYRELLEEINPSSSVPLPDESYPYHYGNVAIRDVSPSGVQLTSADIGFNSKAKTTFRLPTETEWEFAVRGGDPNSSAWRQEYAGSNKAVAVAWFEDNSENHAHEPGVETQGEGEGEAAKPEPMLPVKLAAPDKQGLYNMSGNVWEWCMTDDSLWDSVDTSTNWGNPNFDNKPLANLKRGGGYNDSATYCSNNTGRLKGPKDTDQDTGFRLVRTVSVVN